LLAWIADQRYRKIRDAVSHLVYNPKYFNIGLLDESQLYRIVNSSKTAVAQNPTLMKKVDHYQTMHGTINMTKDEIAEQRAYFLRVWDNLQKNQQQDWQDIFPMASVVASEWRANQHD